MAMPTCPMYTHTHAHISIQCIRVVCVCVYDSSARLLRRHTLSHSRALPRSRSRLLFRSVSLSDVGVR